MREGLMRAARQGKVLRSLKASGTAHGPRSSPLSSIVDALEGNSVASAGAPQSRTGGSRSHLRFQTARLCPPAPDLPAPKSENGLAAHSGPPPRLADL